MGSVILQYVQLEVHLTISSFLQVIQIYQKTLSQELHVLSFYVNL